MEKFMEYIKRPYAEKGVILATVDFVIRALALFVWGYLLFISVGLVVQSLRVDYDPFAKLWWFSYSGIIFIGSSWLAYIILFMRSYYYPNED